MVVPQWGQVVSGNGRVAKTRGDGIISSTFSTALVCLGNEGNKGVKKTLPHPKQGKGREAPPGCMPIAVPPAPPPRRVGAMQVGTVRLRI